jgi:hypothetical protein
VRNAINPLITLFGFTLGALVSGSLIAEIIFSWPGSGASPSGDPERDQYLVLGAVMMRHGADLGNLAADLLLAIADPRIAYTEPVTSLRAAESSGGGPRRPPVPGAAVQRQFRRSHGGGQGRAARRSTRSRCSRRSSRPIPRTRWTANASSTRRTGCIGSCAGRFHAIPFVRPTLVDAGSLTYREVPDAIACRSFSRSRHRLFSVIPMDRHLFTVSLPTACSCSAPTASAATCSRLLFGGRSR